MNRIMLTGMDMIERRVIKRCIVFVIMLLGVVACTKSTSKTALVGESVEEHSTSKLSVVPPDPNIAPDYQRAALANVELGLGYLEQDQVARAKIKLTHAIKLAPNLAETHSAMAYFLEMVGEYKDSEREHKKAISLSGKGAVYNNYGAFLCRRGYFKDAERAFHHAVQDKEYARTAEVFENAGMCALKAANLEKASQYLETAIRRDPRRSTALLELVDLDLKQGKLREAKDLLRRYQDIAEPSARSLWLGIRTARALQDERAMASQSLLLKNLFQDSPEYQLYLQSEQDNT